MLLDLRRERPDEGAKRGDKYTMSLDDEGLALIICALRDAHMYTNKGKTAKYLAANLAFRRVARSIVPNLMSQLEKER